MTNFLSSIQTINILRSRVVSPNCRFLFFFNDTATTEIYTLFPTRRSSDLCSAVSTWLKHGAFSTEILIPMGWRRSEEHTSELQSLTNLVCRLLLEKKKNLTK